jgi:hypothetical protein
LHCSGCFGADAFARLLSRLCADYQTVRRNLAVLWFVHTLLQQGSPAVFQSLFCTSQHAAQQITEAGYNWQKQTPTQWFNGCDRALLALFGNSAVALTVCWHPAVPSAAELVCTRCWQLACKFSAACCW